MEMRLRAKQFILVLLLPLWSFAQNDSTDGDGMVYSRYVYKLDFPIRSGSLVASYQNEREVLYLTDKSTEANVQAISYSNYYTVEKEFQAHSLIKKPNGHYKKKKVKEFSKKTITSSGIFYDDLVREGCSFPGITPGSKSVLKFKSIISDPVLTARCLFNLELFAMNIQCTVNVPDYMKVRLAFFGDSTGITHTTVKTATSTLHSFSAARRAPITYEENSLNVMYYTPHLIVVPISYTLNGKETKLAGTVENLFSRYVKILKEIPAADNKELNKITDSLTAGMTDSAQKVAAVFNWVQKQIRYVAFEEGRGGFVPRCSDKVIANRYGDCKDKANVVVTMLQRAGVPGYHVWIGSRNKPYTYEALPSPHSDDHMIAATRLKGEWIFLDATASEVEFGMPSAFTQGKDALIHLTDSTFLVKQVPVMTAARNLIRDSLKVKLTNNVIEGKGTRIVTGYIREKYESRTAETHSIAPDASDFPIGNNKVVISNLESAMKGPGTLQSSYEFKLSDYVHSFENDTYVNMNLIKDFQREFIELEKRKLDIEADYQYTISQRVTLDIPDGKTIAEVPGNRSFSNEDFSFDIRYTKKGNQLILEKTITINHLILQKKKFADWNRMIEGLTKAYNEVVILRKN
jgi:hypothetical protein